MSLINFIRDEFREMYKNEISRLYQEGKSLKESMLIASNKLLNDDKDRVRNWIKLNFKE